MVVFESGLTERCRRLSSPLRQATGCAWQIRVRRWPGSFFGVGSLAVTTQGHLITGENLQGKRVQKFVVK